MERVELSLSVWKTEVLPLNDIRIVVPRGLEPLRYIPSIEKAEWRWPESNRLRQRLQGAPATLAVTPTGRPRHNLPRPAAFMVLTLWTCQLSSLYERLSGMVNSSRSK